MDSGQKQNNGEPDADALFKIVLLQKPTRLMAYAHTYAKAGLGMKGEALRVQIYYVLGNLGGWKGEIARKTKVELKKIANKIKY